jgi:hypothetical protein
MIVVLHNKASVAFIKHSKQPCIVKDIEALSSLTRQFTRCYGDGRIIFHEGGILMGSDFPPAHGAQRQDHPRIEPQIHRRKKAKAFSALEPEWDHIDQASPSHLRMPSDRMSPTPPNRAKKNSS